jgi:phosphoesterase RecJ-like protein
MFMYDYLRMAEFLLGCDDLLLTAHHDPDADCIGSLLGLYHIFNGFKRGWLIILEDEIPQNLCYLPGVEIIMRPQGIDRLPSAVLMVDCGEFRRVSNGWLESYADLPVYCIDHHVSNEFKGELAVVEPDASSTGEIVTAMCDAAELPVCIDAATCLYSAIVSDTGCFRYDNTTPRALETAAKLLRMGVDMEQVRIKLFESRSIAGIAVLQAAFSNLTFIADGRICYCFVRFNEIVSSGAVRADLNNITNFTLMRDCVLIGLFFEEYSDIVKVSLRSRGNLRMDKLAQVFNGGGHMHAAGCSISGDLDSVLAQVLDKATEFLY